MILQERALRSRKCHLCSHIVYPGENCVRFTSNGTGSHTTSNNLCVRCMEDIVAEHYKEIKNGLDKEQQVKKV